VKLGVGHSPGVEPNVYEIGFAKHLFAASRNQHNGIDKWPVKIELFIVFRAIVVFNEIIQRVTFHESNLNASFNLGFELRHGTNADHLRTILGNPNWEWSSPETGARKVPIKQVLEPFTKPSASRAGRLPVDSVIQLYHPIL